VINAATNGIIASVGGMETAIPLSLRRRTGGTWWSRTRSPSAPIACRGRRRACRTTPRCPASGGPGAVLVAADHRDAPVRPVPQRVDRAITARRALPLGHPDLHGHRLELPAGDGDGDPPLGVAAGTTAAPRARLGGYRLATPKAAPAARAPRPRGRPRPVHGCAGDDHGDRARVGGITSASTARSRPWGAVQLDGAPFDVALSDANTFTSVTIKDCALNGPPACGGTTRRPTAGAGAWQTVAPGDLHPIRPLRVHDHAPLHSPLTVSATSSPTLAQLTGPSSTGPSG